MRNLGSVIWFAWLAGSACAADSLGCPARLVEAGKFHMLDSMKLYDGAAQAEAEILPKTAANLSTWDIKASIAAGASPLVLCSFKHTTDTRQYTLPPTISTCSYTAKFPAMSECH